MAINERLRRHRILRNWRQQDVAEQLDIPLSTLQHWEQGIHSPRAYYRTQLCNLFGLSPQELGLVEEPPPSKAHEDEEAKQQSIASSPEFALWTVPYMRNPHFTGREYHLDHLTNLFFSSQATPTRQTSAIQAHALKGLGGIGKTQIAVEYAYRAHAQSRYQHTIWINGASEETIQESFVALSDLIPTLSGKKEVEQQKRIAEIVYWLEQSPQSWLLIVDNADNLALVQPYVPRIGNGCVLFTTRASAANAFATSTDVDNLSISEGTTFLLRRAGRNPIDVSSNETEEVRRLTEALARFPLALDQAGAYIEETGCSIATYFRLYQEHRQKLLARRGEQITNYPNSVATTWSLSLQQVAKVNPAAAELLCLCSFLFPDHIPEELLVDGGAFWPPLLKQAVADPLTFNQMLKDLRAFSLIRRLTNDHALSLHRLVQFVQMERLSPDEQKDWAERVVRALHTVSPADPSDLVLWPRYQRYMEQIDVCETLIRQHQLQFPEAADVLDRLGVYLFEHAIYPRVELLYKRAQELYEQTLGPCHPDTARSLSHLAILYVRQDKYNLAEPLFERVLSIRQHILESHHLDIADSLNNLANVYRYQGKYKQAETLHKQALEICEEQPGGSLHSLTATSLNHLANLYILQGKYQLGQPLFERALAIRQQIFGTQHLHTARSLNNLASIYMIQKRHALAQPLLEQALIIHEQLLGPRHPDTAQGMSNLASFYVEQGKDAEAEELFLQALSIREQQLGSHHSSVTVTLISLAMMYRDQGKYEQASPLFVRAIAIQERVNEPMDPNLADSRHQFACLLHLQGNDSEARELFERALMARTHILGAAHPDTIETRNQLIVVLRCLGYVTEAEQLSAQLLE